MSEPTILVERSDALPLVGVTVAFRSGAAADPEAKDGLSRIAARMLRRGAGGMTSPQIEERIDSLGADLGVEVGASATTIHGDVIERSLDAYVDLLGTLLGDPTFDEQELGRLLREAEGELVEARDNDRTLATRYFRRFLFEGHPYGRRIAGQVRTLRGIDRDDVVAHYRRAFAREGAIVGFSGAIDEARARDLGRRLIDRLPEGPPAGADVPPPAARPGRRLVLVDKPARTQTQILLGGLGAHPREDDFLALHVATTAFGGTFTSRLMREVRTKRGWSYGAYARLGFDRQRDALSLWTFPKAEDAGPCVALELDLLRAWREGGAPSREIGFAQRYLVRSHAFEVDTAHKRLHQKLDVLLYDLPPDYHATYVDRVKAVRPDEANRAAAGRAPDGELLVVVVGTRAQVGDAVASAIPDLGETVVVPFDEE